MNIIYHHVLIKLILIRILNHQPKKVPVHVIPNPLRSTEKKKHIPHTHKAKSRFSILIAKLIDEHVILHIQTTLNKIK